MNQNHKWIEHHRNGPAIYFKCLRCKRFAFILDYNCTNSHLDLLIYDEVFTLEEKFYATLQYIDKHSTKYSKFRTSYILEKDVNMLRDVCKWNCNELDVKDIFSMNLLERLESIKKYTRMYFKDPTIESLYSFLQGWDSAANTSWCKILIREISKKKRLGSKVPDENDISFEDALDMIMEIVSNTDVDKNGHIV